MYRLTNIVKVIEKWGRGREREEGEWEEREREGGKIV